MPIETFACPRCGASWSVKIGTNMNYSFKFCGHDCPGGEIAADSVAPSGTPPSRSAALEQSA